MNSLHRARNRGLLLAVVCLSAYVINLDMLIVNATLPSLVRELGATNRDLQWVIDAYNLTFATFVLPAGALADRFGRRGWLMAGLGLFAIGAVAGSSATSMEGLIAARAAMGLGAAAIFPATLSIITAIFPDRVERSRAIAVWAAVTGAGIATGPLAGGALLEKFWWGSVFLYMAPVALVTLALTWWMVPTSRDPATPPLDRGGLILSAGAVGVAVYTIIEGPHHGWGSGATMGGFGVAALLLIAFVLWERGRTHPMVDVGLFANLRFSSACASVTIGWFCFLGFALMITQYFQYLKGYSALTYGMCVAPVAVSVAAGSVLGILAVHRWGTRLVITTGLVLAAFFGWVATLTPTSGYWPQIVGQMVVLGLGLGSTTAPATETIMDVVPAAKAAVGSAMNDATRELGGTLGVAVIGSIFASAYVNSLEGSGVLTTLSPTNAETVRESAGQALVLADQNSLPGLRAATFDAFQHGLHVGCAVAAAVALVGAAFAAATLPTGRIHGYLGPQVADDAETAHPAPASSSTALV